MYQDILEQVVHVLAGRLDEDSAIGRDDIVSFLTTPREDRVYEYDPDDGAPLWCSIDRLVELAPIVLKGICFDKECAGALEELRDVFENLKLVCFYQCEFHLRRLPSLHVDLQFENSVFFVDFEVPLEGSHDIPALFVDCEFRGKVKIVGQDRDAIEWGVFTSAIFKNCQLKSLVVEKTCLRANLFEKTSSDSAALDSLVIRDCVFDAELNLNGCDVGALQIVNARFKRKLILKSASFQSFDVESSQFKALMDCEGASFGRMRMERCRFFDVLNLESARYVGGAESNAASCISFKFCTFDKVINFRNGSFEVELDLRYSNRKELPNFIGVRFNRRARKKTDRETFRIIKNSFEAVGNQVEANAYFAMEMEAYRLELKGQPGKLSERFLLACNGLMSDHGQSYIRPVFLIVLLMGIFQVVRYGFEQNWVFQYCPQVEPYIQVANDWAQGLIVFQLLMKTKGLELVSLFFGLLFSILLWQTLTAIRRHTRK